ncbi:MAG TPA: chromate transporter [Candidatus Saccharimonadales bacterium]|jgi:chromate transporter|nr:chromate transporter [Candidatus Saccharimonadales bacterium]
MTQPVRYGEIAAVFTKVGMTAFGGWSTTALLLEKELVVKRALVTEHHVKGAIAFAQMLPGGTQVSIVAHVGYRLRGWRGATIATLCFLCPALVLIALFAALYFHNSSISARIMTHLGGLIAALAGLILANAYKIGGRHTTHAWMWVFALVAFVAKWWLNVNAFFIIIAFGLGALLISWTKARKALQ